MERLVCKDSTVRVSSVLNRDVKQFGKKYLFDGNDETCWNSDQGLPQWIQVDFPAPVDVKEVQIKFQGGFVGSECVILKSQNTEQEMEKAGEFYPEDINSLQIFPLQDVNSVKRLRFVFEKSTDFFGRVTIYEFNILGNKL